jgi:peptide/nickel transport system permease protein
MGLKGYLARKVVYLIILVYFVISLNFVIFMLMPGDPTAVFAGAARIQDQATLAAVRARYGLDQPLGVKYLDFLYNCLTFYFGYSYQSNKPVADEISGRLMNTLALVGLSTVLAILLGTILGVIAAAKRGKTFDSANVSVSLVFFSVPSFWIGMMLLTIFSTKLGWFPDAGAIPRSWAFNPPANILAEIAGRLHHLFLPVLTLTLFQYGGYLLLARATMLEALTEDYIVTARAKGVKERAILYKHALRNASLPLITNIALSFGFMLSGAIITETVFTYGGLGYWLFQAINFADYPVLNAMFYVIALCVIAANFISDLLYGVVDPRIRYG